MARQAPHWRPDLAAELEAHRAIGMRPAQIAPQIAGLRQDLDNCLRLEPRMRTYAAAILTEAEAALPYGRRPTAGYAPRRQQLGQRRALVSDTWPLEVLEARWHDRLATNLTVAVWVVRRLIRLHDLRHGAYVSPYAEGFLAGGHVLRVEEMQKTLLGGHAPDRRYVRAWRADHA